VPWPRWAKWIQIWRAGGRPADAEVVASDFEPASQARDIYCYFDNTDKVHAPANALRLLEMVNGPSIIAAMPPKPVRPAAVRRVADRNKAPV
jgi:uncharacterized protein YecE (DUF72 family)